MRRSEKYIELAEEALEESRTQTYNRELDVARAQVYATLAVAAATREQVTA